MATIGTFTRGEDGSFSGTIRTLTLNVKASVRPERQESERAPDYRIYAGASAFGAAWSKTSREGRDYLSVKLDDPSLPAPIYATLVETEGGQFDLIWSR